jgi:nucleotide-sensitive chloride channel 1A
MIATTIRTLPTVGDYIPLSDYESQTPNSFVDGKAVLHHYISGAKASIPKDQAGKLAIFPSDAAVSENRAGEQVIEQDVDVFVNSEYVLPSMNAAFRTANQAAAGPSRYSAAKPKQVSRFPILRYLSTQLSKLPPPLRTVQPLKLSGCS